MVFPLKGVPMAKFYPARPRFSAQSEARVWRAFGALDDEWRVFHSVAWQSQRGGREGDGEADFVLLHPGHGLIVLEVKGGKEIYIDRGTWYSVSGGNQTFTIRNPYEQAVASKHALLRYLDTLLPLKRIPPVVHGVVFPGATVLEPIGMQPLEITIDGAGLAEPSVAMARLLRHWDMRAHMEPSEVGKVTKLLAPTTRVQSRLRNVIADTVAELIQLTEAQARALQGLRRTRRAVVYGAAGTGKTVLAAQRAKRLAQDGFTTLLTCFNQPLAEHLKVEVTDHADVTVATFHQLCLSQARQAGLSLPENLSQEWWDYQAPDVLIEAIDGSNLRFDAVVVDEGQDFSQDWINALLFTLTEPDRGPFYVFADTQQSIYHRDWAVPEEWAVFDLDINCRNSVPIAERVSRVFGHSVKTLSAAGAKPQFVQVRSSEEALGVIPQLVQNLLTAEGLSPSQCAVITTERRQAERLHEIALEDASFVPLGKTGVIAETIYRFKGLEADVIIADLTSSGLNQVDLATLGYIGMSRARAFLVVVGTKETAERLNWSGN